MKLWNGELNFIKTRDKPKLTDQCMEGHGFNSRRGLRFYSDFPLMIPVGDPDFCFVPRSRQVEYSIFSYFFSELKIHHLSLFITYRALRYC